MARHIGLSTAFYLCKASKLIDPWQPGMDMIELATPSDLPAIETLLRRSGLPQDGVGDRLATTLVAREAERIVGTAALELYGLEALLRSVAVDPARQGLGLGQLLTRAALELARQHDVTRVYLLTETADGFFPRFGFRPLPRTDVPANVQTSGEFTHACPASALAMLASLETRSSPPMPVL